MKTVFTIIAVIMLVSCKKDNPKISDPQLTVLTPRCEGGTIKSVAIPFNLYTNGTSVSKVELYKSPTTKISEITLSSDGMYTLYDGGMATCPKQSDNVTYYFMIDKSDNTKITTATFAVYF